MDNNIGMSSESLADVVVEHDEQEITDRRLDYVKKIEKYNVGDITADDVEFMIGSIQGFFRETFPVKSELVDQLPMHTVVLNEDEWGEMRNEVYEKVGVDCLGDKTGFYNVEQNKIFINQMAHDTPAALFATMFHESLHFVSIGADAGFAGGFLLPAGVEENEEMTSRIDMGIHTLIEGTTQLITLANVIEKMGFEEDEEMFGYEPEWRIMETVWLPFSREERLHAYFGMTMEEVRIYIEKVLDSEGDAGSIGPGVSNGMFAECLLYLGDTTEKMSEVLGDWDNEGDSRGILEDVSRAVEFYVARDRQMGDGKLNEEEKSGFYEK